MRFKRAVQRYGRTPEPDTPYARAGQLWDERIGSARVQARNWRLMALGGLLLSSGLSVGLVWQSLQSRVIPYVVEVDRLGDTLTVAPADSGFQPTDPQISYQLSAFIRKVRGISLDPVLMREQWLEAYDFASGKGALFLNDYARSSDPFGQVGARTVSVQVTSVVRASDKSFQVKWTESIYERGSLASTSRWTALLTIALRSPRTAEAVRKNPLGLFVEAIDWSRELESPVEPAPEALPAPPPNIPTGSPVEPPASPPQIQTRTAP